jgi:hypothetical protein
VEVREKNVADVAQQHPELRNPDGRATTAIEEQRLSSGLDENARAKTIRVWTWPATGAEERHDHRWALCAGSLTDQGPPAQDDRHHRRDTDAEPSAH